MVYSRTQQHFFILVYFYVCLILLFASTFPSLMEFQFLLSTFGFYHCCLQSFHFQLKLVRLFGAVGRREGSIDVIPCYVLWSCQDRSKETKGERHTAFGVNFAWNVSLSLSHSEFHSDDRLLVAHCERVLMFQVWRNYPSTLYRGREYFYDPQMTKYGHNIGFTIDFVFRIMYSNSHSVDCEWAKKHVIYFDFFFICVLMLTLLLLS